MKANSNNHPGIFTCTHGKWFYNFNIVESETTDEFGNTRTSYDYDYVEVTGDPAKDKQIDWDQAKVDAFIDAIDKVAKERPALKLNVDVSRLVSPSDEARKTADAVRADYGWSIRYAI